MEAMRSIMHRLKLTVNEEKTHICRLPDESFDFLGYTFGRCYSTKTGFRFIGQRPSKQKIMAICRQISEWTTANWCWLDEEEQIGRLNRMMVGWSNYFCQGPVNKAYRRINTCVLRTRCLRRSSARNASCSPTTSVEGSPSKARSSVADDSKKLAHCSHRTRTLPSIG